MTTARFSSISRAVAQGRHCSGNNRLLSTVSNKNVVAVGISGGVDSAVTAALLLQQVRAGFVPHG